MQQPFQDNSMDETQYFLVFDAECKRKEKLLDEFEKLERKERRRKKPKTTTFQRKYERMTKGLYIVQKIKGNHIHLADTSGKRLGVLQVTSEVSKFLHVNDGLEGVFGFRNHFWRVQFIFCIANSSEDFIQKNQ